MYYNQFNQTYQNQYLQNVNPVFYQNNQNNNQIYRPNNNYNNNIQLNTYNNNNIPLNNFNNNNIRLNHYIQFYNNNIQFTNINNKAAIKFQNNVYQINNLPNQNYAQNTNYANLLNNKTLNNNKQLGINNNNLNNKAYIPERKTNIPLISPEKTKNILSLVDKCICKISKTIDSKEVEGTGFFCIIFHPDQNKLLPVLITNNHVLNANDIKENEKIILSFDKIKKTIEITNSRKTYTDDKLDITIIEIKPNIDKINNFLDVDDYNNKNYKDEDICVLQFPSKEEDSLLLGKIIEINEKNFNYNCKNEYGSSGGPIISLSNNNVIGLHKESIKSNNNKGIFIKYGIEQFNKKNYMNNLNNKKPKNDNNNYIIAEIWISKEDLNKKIRIINSFEQAKRENLFYEGVNNEKTIIENCVIKVNNIVFPFSYFCKFKSPGKHTIEYSFKNYLTNTNYMFFDCVSLTNLDLSNFNTKNISNMRCMFSGCISLTNLNLSNFNTNNVINMRCMFRGCSSLTYLDLTCFNTNNVTDMGYMFSECSSLINLHLSNFNTEKVIDMGYMFFECSSLIKLVLSNFNTKNVKNMMCMFSGCYSLPNLDLSNFSTENVTNMALMFQGCSSLININVSNNKKMIDEFHKNKK